MNNNKNKRKQVKPQQNANLQFCDERTELLFTIQDLVEIEVDRRMDAQGSSRSKRPPPKQTFFTRFFDLIHQLLC